MTALSISLPNCLSTCSSDPDFEKGAHTFIQDYRSGALGRISLETPETRQVMLDEAKAEVETQAFQEASKMGKGEALL